MRIRLTNYTTLSSLEWVVQSHMLETDDLKTVVCTPIIRVCEAVCSHPSHLQRVVPDESIMNPSTLHPER